MRLYGIVNRAGRLHTEHPATRLDCPCLPGGAVVTLTGLSRSSQVSKARAGLRSKCSSNPSNSSRNSSSDSSRAADLPTALYEVNDSVRQPKDIRQFSSIEDLHSSLHDKQGFQAGLPGLLNWLSDNAFGRPRSGGGWLSCAYRALTKPVAHNRSPDTTARAVKEAEIIREVAAGAGRQIPSIMLTSPSSITKIALRYPAILNMSSSELAERLVGLKALLPGCDVSLMVERQPAPYLCRSRTEVELTVKAAYNELHTHMRGANIELMLEADPGLLFVDVARGVRQLRELWDVDAVDEHALRNSDPTMLALAVRTLSDAGPPKVL